MIERPGTSLTVRDVFRIYTRDRGEAARLLEGPPMSDAWKRWATDFLDRTRGRPADVGEPGCC